MATEPKVLYEVFTDAEGNVVERGDPAAVEVEIVYVDPDGTERRVHANLAG